MKFLPMSQLTIYERERIEFSLRVGMSNNAIAKKLNRDRRVIDREIKRNKSPILPYTARSAQQIFEVRKKKKHKHKLETFKYQELRKYVIEKIKDDWSPEEISGRLKNELVPHIKQRISHEAIYQYIYNGEGRYENLFSHLRTHRPKRKPKFKRKNRQFTIANRISIHERPVIVNERNRFGDWEDDSMIFSKQKNVLAVQFERKSKLCRITKLPNKTAEEHENAIWKSIESLPNELWQTITRDNGTENAKHESTKDVFGVQSFYCDGYCSWQKGGVENTNKLIRQYLPRSTNLDNLDDDDIFIFQEKLNNRPRKALNYLTPNETIANFLKS
jgi:transposase, IS30 family